MSKVLLFSLLFFITASFADGFEIPSFNAYPVYDVEIGGDFDGDGTKDLIVLTNKPSGSAAVSGTIYGAIYSFAKKQYLLTFPKNRVKCQFADLDGQPGEELILDNKIYKYGDVGTGSSAK